VCGQKDASLDTHEVWDFDIKSKTQSLKDIIALCSACHGVKHIRNSQRIGYGENAKKHFLRINKCDTMTFAKHYTDAQILFDKRNEILRWNIRADLESFGGKGIEIKERNIPLIVSPYDGIDWLMVERVRAKKSKGCISITVINESGKKAKYYTSRPQNLIGSPKIRSINADNYQGTITVTSEDANKIEWILDGKKIKTKYNFAGKFVTMLKAEGLDGSKIRFRLIGNGGITLSQEFSLEKVDNGHGGMI